MVKSTKKQYLNLGKGKFQILKTEHFTKENGKEIHQNEIQGNWNILACIVGPDLSKKTKGSQGGGKTCM